MKNDEKEIYASVDLLDILLNPDNNAPIVLTDDAGNELLFGQVATIPYRENNEATLYCILRPLERIKGVADDEAIVFRVDIDEDGNTSLSSEDDDARAEEIFARYEQLLEEAEYFK